MLFLQVHFFSLTVLVPLLLLLHNTRQQQHMEESI